MVPLYPLRLCAGNYTLERHAKLKEIQGPEGEPNCEYFQLGSRARLFVPTCLFERVNDSANIGLDVF